MINIGKAIYTLLSSNTSLTNIVSANKIQPLVLAENTILPAIVYERNFTTEGNKDSYTSTNTIDITTLSNYYDESINIALLIEDILSGYEGTASGINIINSRLIAGDETIVEDVFLQKLTFSIKSI